MLGTVEQSLIDVGQEVVWLTNLAEVELSVPIANGLDSFRIAVGGRCWTLDHSSILLLADAAISYSERQGQSIAIYRRAETYAAWLTLLTLFPGRAINRPSTVTAPIHFDAFLTRNVARALGIPTIAETIFGPGRKVDLAETTAASDLASGLSFWTRPADDRAGSILSFLEYPPDAHHYVAAVLPGETLLMSYSLGRDCRFVNDAAARAAGESAGVICSKLGLEYAYVVFARTKDLCLLSRIYTAPPPVIGEECSDAIGRRLASRLASDG